MVGDLIVKSIKGWRLSKRMKSSVAVKSIPDATTKGKMHHIKGYLEDNSPDSIILNKNKETTEDIVNNIRDIAILISKEGTNVFVSGLTVRNGKH